MQRSLNASAQQRTYYRRTLAFTDARLPGGAQRGTCICGIRPTKRNPIQEGGKVVAYEWYNKDGERMLTLKESKCEMRFTSEVDKSGDVQQYVVVSCPGELTREMYDKSFEANKQKPQEVKGFGKSAASKPKKAQDPEFVAKMGAVNRIERMLAPFVARHVLAPGDHTFDKMLQPLRLQGMRTVASQLEPGKEVGYYWVYKRRPTVTWAQQPRAYVGLPLQIESPPPQKALEIAYLRVMIKGQHPNTFRPAAPDEVFIWGDRIRRSIRVELAGSRNPQDGQTSSSAGDLLADTSDVTELVDEWVDLDTLREGAAASKLVGSLLGNKVGDQVTLEMVIGPDIVELIKKSGASRKLISKARGQPRALITSTLLGLEKYVTPDLSSTPPNKLNRKAKTMDDVMRESQTLAAQQIDYYRDVNVTKAVTAALEPKTGLDLTAVDMDHVAKFMQRGIVRKLQTDPAFGSVIKDLVSNPAFTEKYVYDQGFQSDVNKLLMSRVPNVVRSLYAQEAALCDIAVREGLLYKLTPAEWEPALQALKELLKKQSPWAKEVKLLAIQQGLGDQLKKPEYGRDFKYFEFDMHVFWFDTTVRDLAISEAKKFVVQNADVKYVESLFMKAGFADALGTQAPDAKEADKKAAEPLLK